MPFARHAAPTPGLLCSLSATSPGAESEIRVHTAMPRRHTAGGTIRYANPAPSPQCETTKHCLTLRRPPDCCEESCLRLKFSIALCLGLLGCAQPSMRSSAEPPIHLSFESLPTLLVVYNDDYDCYGQHAGLKTSKGVELELAPKPYMTVTFQYISVDALQINSCLGTATFAVGNAREFRGRPEGTSQGCRLIVEARDSSAAGGWRIIPLKSRHYTTPVVDMHGPFCEASPAFRGSSEYVVPRPSSE